MRLDHLLSKETLNSVTSFHRCDRLKKTDKVDGEVNKKSFVLAYSRKISLFCTGVKFSKKISKVGSIDIALKALF